MTTPINTTYNITLPLHSRTYIYIRYIHPISFRWEGGAGLGLLKSDNYFETLYVKQYLKIQAEFQINLIHRMTNTKPEPRRHEDISM